MKFSKKGLQDYVTDPNMESEGVDIHFGDADLTVTIRRAGGANRKFDPAVAKHSKPYRKKLRSNSLPVDVFRSRVLVPSYFDAVVIGWEGVNDEDGQTVPFTRENFTAFVEAFPEIFDELVDHASSPTTFQEDSPEEVIETLGE